MSFWCPQRPPHAADLPHRHAADRPDRHGQGQGRQADRRTDGEGFHRHRGRRAADRSASSSSSELDAARPAPRRRRAPAVAPPRRRHRRAAPPAQAQIASRRRATSGTATAGCWSCTSIRRRCRRAIRCAPTRTRRKYIDTQMEPADLVAIMTFQGGAVRVRQDFTDNRAQLRRGHPVADLRRRSGRRRHSRHRCRHRHRLRPGRRRVQHLQHRSPALGAADGGRHAAAAARAEVADLLRQRPPAERHRQPGAAARHDQRGDPANVVIHPIDARGLVATPPLGDAHAAVARAASACSPAGSRETQMASFQRSQDSLYALAKDTGGKAMFDYNDLSLGIAQAADAMTSYYLLGYYSTHTAPRRQVPPRAGHAERRPGRRAVVPPGVFRRQGVREVHGRRQGTPARGGADAGEPDHRDHDRDGGELLPAESRRVLRAGRRQDSRQRAGARAPRRRAAHGDRLHRRGEGRLRRHDAERPGQAGHQAERRRPRPSSRRGPSSTRPASRCCPAST